MTQLPTSLVLLLLVRASTEHLRRLVLLGCARARAREALKERTIAAFNKAKPKMTRPMIQRV